MRTRSFLAFIFLCSCLVTSAPAQNAEDALTKKVDQLFATWDKPESPGAAGDKLMGQPGGSPKAELIPQSETTFFVREANSEVIFERDEKGSVVGFTMKRDSQSQTAKRLNAPPATAAQLTQFAGDYYSAELGTTYTLVVVDGKLVAQHRRHDDISLTELDGDLFSGNRWFFQTVQFTRDNEKRISGFRLTSGRARNVRFDRQKGE